jgi:D-methionine transport system ATP-binding protein
VALRDINLTIEDGEIFGIIGLSGAGKSTLVRCINLLERPTEGDVLIDGQSLTKMPRRELLEVRRNIGMIFQGFNLLEQRNVLRNICYPLEIARVPRAQAEARARELLRVVGLEDREKAYPAQLSGGQKQRVAIARALATNPKYLLCDEATSALDPNTTRAILELLREINRTMGVTIVVITHEMKVIDTICDRVAIIDHSRIAEVGKVSDVFSSPRSDIARELILPMASASATTACGRRLRIVFDGTSSQKPLISNMIMTCQVAVSILFADIKDVNGASYGHMIIELPDDDRAELKVISWIMNNGLKYTREA